MLTARNVADETASSPEAAGRRRFDQVAGLVGETPVLDLGAVGPGRGRLVAKLEGHNPTGSVKDRACVEMFRRMLRDPHWDPSRTILDASSGSMGCSIAYFGRVLGASVTIVSSSKLTAEKAFFIQHLGSKVSKVGTFTIEGNQICRDLVSESPSAYYFLDQLHNSANPDAHFFATGPEILRQVPDVCAVVASIGSGGTLLGVGRYLKAARPNIQIVAVEAASGTRIPGTAALVDGDYRSPFIAEGYDRKVFDLSIQVPLREAVSTCESLLGSGLFGGIQSGAAVWAARRAADLLALEGDVVTISGDTGWKNIGALSASTTSPSAEG